MYISPRHPTPHSFLFFSHATPCVCIVLPWRAVKQLMYDRTDKQLTWVQVTEEQLTYAQLTNIWRRYNWRATGVAILLTWVVYPDVVTHQLLWEKYEVQQST